MSLKPNPPRPGDSADKERYEHDLADMKARPWAWGINPGQVEAEKSNVPTVKATRETSADFTPEPQTDNPDGSAVPEDGNEKGQAGPADSTTTKRRGRKPKAEKGNVDSERNGDAD